MRVKGRSCHGSMPHLGDNAIYRIAPAIVAIEKLNDRLKDDAFLGKGTCTISWIGCQTPSLCAVPAEAEFHIDRRLTVGETRESALAEVEAAMKEAGVEAEVFTLTYREKAWTGLEYPMDKYYPTWVLDEGHPALQAAQRAFAEHGGTAGRDRALELQHQRRGHHGSARRVVPGLRPGPRRGGAHRERIRADRRRRGRPARSTPPCRASCWPVDGRGPITDSAASIWRVTVAGLTRSVVI